MLAATLLQMQSVFNWFALIITLFIGCLSIDGRIVHVAHFGAYPNDNIDDSAAIQSAVNAAIDSKFNSTVIFGYGIYNFSSSIFISDAVNLTIEGQGTDETFLVGNQPIRIFWIESCEGFTLRAVSIDFDPLPFTAGYVVNVSDTYIDVEIQPPHRADVGRQIQYILRYNTREMRPAFGPNTYGIYQDPPTNANTSLVSTNILRMPLASPSKFVVGDAVVGRYDNTNDAVFAHNVTDFTIQSINIYTSWTMGFVTHRAKRLNVLDLHVIPREGRWLSTTSDCIHLVSSEEFIRIMDTKCRGTGDDGLNVLASYLLVTEVMNSTTMIITILNFTSPYPEVGSLLEFSSQQQPFTVHGSGVITSVTNLSPYTRLLTFANAVNASAGDLACHGDTPALTIHNFTVENNRARGVLLETRNIDVRNCVFNRTSGPAVLIQPSLYWHEGPAARNVTLVGNQYINCNEGIGQEKGIISILPVPTQLIPVIDDIRIESSTFLFGNYSQGLILVNNAHNLFFNGNYLVVNVTTPIISLCNSRNITASNNTIVDSLGKIDQYYTFDETYPCQTNLSSLIDLPPSAFNSSFPPPV